MLIVLSDIISSTKVLFDYGTTSYMFMHYKLYKVLKQICNHL